MRWSIHSRQLRLQGRLRADPGCARRRVGGTWKKKGERGEGGGRPKEGAREPARLKEPDAGPCVSTDPAGVHFVDYVSSQHLCSQSQTQKRLVRDAFLLGPPSLHGSLESVLVWPAGLAFSRSTQKENFSPAGAFGASNQGPVLEPVLGAQPQWRHSPRTHHPAHSPTAGPCSDPSMAQSKKACPSKLKTSHVVASGAFSLAPSRKKDSEAEAP